MIEEVQPMPWIVVHGEDLLHMLTRVSLGELPMVVFAEFYANCEREDYSE
jgi:hypothetical protein